LAGQVELVLRMARGLGHMGRGEPEADKPDRQVDQEDRAPTDQRDQGTADERPRGQRKTRARRPHGHCTTPRPVVGKSVVEQRQRVRHQDRCAKALHAARRDQARRIRRQRTGERGRGEDHKPRHEDAPGAQAVAERTGGQDEGGKGDGVGVDHPLQFGDAAAERGRDAGERGVHDGHVKLHHAIAEAHGSKCQRDRRACIVPVSRGALLPGPNLDLSLDLL